MVLPLTLILSMAAHKASLEIFDKAGMKALRKKSVMLTGFLEFLLNQKSEIRNLLFKSLLHNKKSFVVANFPFKLKRTEENYLRRLAKRE